MAAFIRAKLNEHEGYIARSQAREARRKDVVPVRFFDSQFSE
jgi:hypothetical protein